MDEKTGDPLKKEIFENNPWLVEDPSAFLKYCCPECDYKNEELLIFTNHALEKHVNASLLFTPDAILNIKNEHFDEQTDYYSELPLHSELHDNDQFDPGLIKKEKNEHLPVYQLDDSYEIEKIEVAPRSSKLKALLIKGGVSENNKHPKTKMKVHSCTYCDYKAMTMQKIQRHIDAKHPEHDTKNFFCDKCDKSFIYKISFNQHTKYACTFSNAEKVPKLVCEQCGFTTKLKTLLTSHIKNKHEPEKHKKCPYCEFKSPLSKQWKKHIDQFHPEHDEKKFVCDKCSMRFIFQVTLSGHICEKLKCEKCDFSTSYPHNLKHHVKTQHEKSICKKCNKSLDENHKCISFVKRPLHSCPYCEYKDKPLQKMQRHIDAKHPEHDTKNFFCDKCDKSFIYQTTFNHHANYACTYSNTEKVPKLVCEICGFSTKLKTLLKSHVRNKHEPEKHNKCPYCDFRAPLAKQWKKHIDQFHPEHDEKKFVCDKCSMSFIFQVSLSAHVCDKLKCDRCEFSTSHASSLKFHEQTHH